jgi:tetratricopeptide (TPR) repeat protein
VALSNIENNKIEAKSKTFNALCKKMGSTETKYPCFESEREFQIVLNLNRARCYMSIGEYCKAAEEMLNCEFTSEVSVEYRAEFLLLAYVILKIVRVEDNHIDYFVDISMDSLRITERRPESFKTVLEYEIYVYFNMLIRNKTKIAEAIDILKEAPLMASEIEFVRMMAYACLSYIYRDRNLVKARKFAIEGIKRALKSGCYCVVFDLYDIVFENDGFHHTIEDIFDVFGTEQRISKDKINKLIQRAVKVSRMAEVRESDKVYSTAEILKNMKGSFRKKYICKGLCTESAYAKFLAGISRPSVVLFENLIERCGITTEPFVIWGPVDSDSWGDILDVDLIYNSRFSTRELIKIKEKAAKLAEDGRVDEAKETLKRIILYLEDSTNDISMLSKVFPDVVNQYVRLLCDLKEYDEIIEFIECRKYPEFLFDIKLTGEIFRIYCKACEKYGKEVVFAKRVVEVIDEIVELNEK